MPKARYCFLIPLGATLACLATLTALAALGWPGDVGAAGRDFCEAARLGAIRQPANTWSNAGFYLLALWVGWQSWSDVAARKSASWSNRLVTTVGYPASLATCSALIGTGSAALHASMTTWGAELDHFALHLWGGWMVAFALTRALRGSDRLFLRLWSSIVAGVAVRLALGEPYAMKGSTLFGVLVGLSIVIELVGRWRNRAWQRMENRYLVWAIATFSAAYACLLVSSNAGPWCEPTSLWQGHAAWHLLAAGSTAFVYLYGRSERMLPTRNVRD